MSKTGTEMLGTGVFVGAGVGVGAGVAVGRGVAVGGDAVAAGGAVGDAVGGAVGALVGVLVGAAVGVAVASGEAANVGPALLVAVVAAAAAVAGAAVAGAAVAGGRVGAGVEVGSFSLSPGRIMVFWLIPLIAAIVCQGRSSLSPISPSESPGTTTYSAGPLVGVALGAGEAVADGDRVGVGVGVRVTVGDGCVERATRLPWVGVAVGVASSGICTRLDNLACAAAASCLTCCTGSLPQPQ